MTDTASISEYLACQRLLFLDGGLATELERRGADLKHELWSARMLIERPELVRDVHLDFLQAGADIITTASYQASLPGFERAGLRREEAVDAMRRSVAVAFEAREIFMAENTARERLRPLVAASVGPYGACLHDGSEYTGVYDLSRQALMDFHRPRMEILVEADPDLVAFETIPSLHEAEALLELLGSFDGVFAWLSSSCRDARHVSHGETFADCAALVKGHPQIVGVGVNCTDPAHVPGLLASVGSIDVPLLAYPNSGEAWDAKTQEWEGQGTARLDARSWIEAGARLVGGCCRVGPGQITAMRGALLGECG